MQIYLSSFLLPFVACQERYQSKMRIRLGVSPEMGTQQGFIRGGQGECVFLTPSRNSKEA